MGGKKAGNKGITPRATDYSAWYTDLILKADLSPSNWMMVLGIHIGVDTIRLFLS